MYKRQAQSGVKKIFGDETLRREMNAAGYQFSSANSINIGRLVPQIVYYYWAYIQAVKMGEIKWGEPLDFTVPTGKMCIRDSFWIHPITFFIDCQ